MKKCIILSLLFLYLVSCSFVSKKEEVSALSNEKIVLSAEEENFLEKRNLENNLVLFGINNELISIILPRDFNWYYSNTGRGKNYLMYEFLQKGKTFENLNKIITVSETSLLMDVDAYKFSNALKEYTKNDGICKQNKSKFDIIEQNNNSFTYVMQCGELIPGKIPGQKGKQGELTFAKYKISKFGNETRIFGTLYAIRQETFNFKELKDIINSSQYKEFEKVFNSVLVCNKSSDDNICKSVMNLSKKDSEIIKYKIPNNCISDKKLAEQYKVDDILIKNGDNLETTKNPVVLIKYIDKNNMSFRDVISQELLNIKNNIKDVIYDENFINNKVFVNNLKLYMTELYGTYVDISKKDKNSVDSFIFLALDLKDKIVFIDIYPNNKNGVKTGFVNDFIKSIEISK